MLDSQRASESAASGPAGAHLVRLQRLVAAGLAHGERAQQLHDRAGLRIDAALYDLEQLRAELETVVPRLGKAQASAH